MKPARLIAILFMVGVLGVVIALPIMLATAFTHTAGKAINEMEHIDFQDSDFDGTPVEEGMNLLPGPYTAVSQTGPVDIVWKRSDKTSFVVSGDQKTIAALRYKFIGDNLQFGFDKKLSGDNLKTAKIILSGPQPHTYTLAGSGDFNSNDFKGGELELTVAGSGNCILAGALDSADITVAGSGEVKGKSLHCQESTVSISGSGKVALDAIKTLDVSIAGSGTVNYFGNPEVEKSIVGSGLVVRVGG